MDREEILASMRSPTRNFENDSTVGIFRNLDIFRDYSVVHL